MEILFKKDAWQKDLFVVANSYRFQEVPDFEAEADAIVNRKSQTSITGYENASLMLKEKQTGNVSVTIDCAFDAWGAPLIVIAEDLAPDKAGFWRYREYYEVVLYEEGVNVWRLCTDANDEVTWKKMMSVDFPVSPVEKHTLTVDILEDTLEITADGRKMSLFLSDRFPTYYLGIDACENINRFYRFAVEKRDADTKSGFVCSFCGHLHKGDTPPERCPDCGVGPEKFVLKN